MTKCSAINCKNLGVHIFPKDPKRRKKWENALRIKNFKASNTAKLCARHFKEDDYYGISKYTGFEPLAKFLKKTAIPSIFCFTEKLTQSPAALKREQDFEERRQKKLHLASLLQSSRDDFTGTDVVDPLVRDTGSDVGSKRSSSDDFTDIDVADPFVSDTSSVLGPKRSSSNDFTGIDVADPFVSDTISVVGGEEEICTSPEFRAHRLCIYLPDITEETTTAPTDPERPSKSTQVNHEYVYGSINRFKDDDKSILFYTGFETYKKFHLAYSTLKPMAHRIRYHGSNILTLSTEDQFFMTMMKLRQNKCNFELSRFFDISETMVCNVIITWVNFIHQMWSRINIWPNKELIQYYMPEHFKRYDENIQVILDETEIPVQKFKHPFQDGSWSSKHSDTLKVLVGQTPGGLLSYCSQAYASISDRQTVEQTDLWSKCQSGDSILVGKGFTAQDMFEDNNIVVKSSTFLRGKAQTSLTRNDNEHANKRIRLDRFALTKTYKILRAELDHSYIPIASKIFFICFMCCNFRELKTKNKNKNS